jgi:hypothetical protein
MTPDGRIETFQEAYERARDGLLGQGKKCQANDHLDTTVCRFRSRDDDRVLKCAVGWLIPDADYDEFWEDTGDVKEIAENQPAQWNEMSAAIGPVCGLPDAVEFLHSLQSIHDDEDAENWPNALREFAVTWGLTP